MPDRKIKIELKKKSRKGNNRPYGVVIMTVSGNMSMEMSNRSMKGLEDAFNKASEGITTKALIVDESCNIQYISLR